jgi:hypothetical protein
LKGGYLYGQSKFNGHTQNFLQLDLQEDRAESYLGRLSLDEMKDSLYKYIFHPNAS